MNSDATEAALGLLGLSPLNAPQSHPQQHSHHHVAHSHGPTLTSSSVGIAIDRTSGPHIVQSVLPPSLVPLKRKQPSPALPVTSASIPPSTTAPITPSSSRDNLSLKSRQAVHPLAPSSTPPAKSARPLLSNVPTKLSSPYQRHPFSPKLSTSLPPQTPPTTQIQLASPSASQHPLALSDVPPPDSDAIACICGFTYDDGFSIACDDCSRWCHAACFGIVQGGEVPEFWKCWVCDPTVEVDKERAVKIQRGRLKAMRMKASHGINGTAPGATGVNGATGNSPLEEGSGGPGKPVSRRRMSPGAERKAKRGSAVAAAIEGSGSKKKRRASILPQESSFPSPMGPPSAFSVGSSVHPHMGHAGSSSASHLNGNGLVASGSTQPMPVTFPPDVYPNPAVHAHLLRVAKAWRGVTALNPPSPLIHPPPKTYTDRAYTRVESQGYTDRYGYSMSPLDNTTPVILDSNAGDLLLPRTVLRTDPPLSSHSNYPSTSTSYTSSHLRPPSPRLHVAPDPSPFSHTTTYPYPSPPISNYMSPTVPPNGSTHPRLSTKSPLTPSTNTIQSYHASDTIPASTLLAPYTATIVPSAAYLADPLNGYAHLGMGKPQVRLVGGGWGVGLDARGMGGVSDPSELPDLNANVVGDSEDGKGKGKWARCGCWPNAVVRPVVCRGTKRGEGEKGKRRRHKAGCSRAKAEGVSVDSNSDLNLKDGTNDGTTQPLNGDSTTSYKSSTSPSGQARHVEDASDQDQDDAGSTDESDADPTTLSFALFALRDLRADEEIVLGWEWDDGHAVHMLPALMESPGLFGSAHLQHLRAQFTSILHALSSTFTTCACGSSTRDCAVRVMESVVEGRWPWPGGEMTSEEEGSSDEGDLASEDWVCEGERDVDVEGDGEMLRETERRRQGQSQRNRGLGVDMDVDVEVDDVIAGDVNGRRRRPKKGKVRKKGHVRDGHSTSTLNPGASTSISASQSERKGNSHSTSKKVVDLGPLVGVKRGFRTREKAPMSGGWCGVEVVPSSLAAFPDLGEVDGSGRSGKGKGKEKAMETETNGADKDDMDIDSHVSALPPRMRKPWSERLASESDPRQGDQQQRADGRSDLDRWRSPPDTNADSPSSVAGGAEGSHHRIHGSKQGGDEEDGVDGHETEFDTETEADGVDDARQMPPPPMPASLDPTTVSSLAHAQGLGRRSLSPRASGQWERNGTPTNWPPPRVTTPTSAPSQLIGPGIHPTTSLPQIQQNNPSSVTSTFGPSIPPQTPLVPSVSPSAPFSKLSLHSPEPSTPQMSALFSPCDSAMFSPVSSSHQISHQRASSPLLHRPSKPLHVHPENQLPSFSSSAPPPVVTIHSPDGTRDTPAEAQYQQPYRSSPESRPTDAASAPVSVSASPDMEKKRFVNGGEMYRVRFASPEVLSGLPRLRGRDKVQSVVPCDEDGVRMDAVKGPEVAGEQPPETQTTTDGDAMDVDGADSIPEKNGLDDAAEHVPSSPHSQPPTVPPTKAVSTPEIKSSSLSLEPQPPASSYDTVSSATSTAIVMESDPNEPDPSPPPPHGADDTISSVTSTALEHNPNEPDPSPPPPPKVKMSLKDFALRKKRQREEEMAAKALISPATPDGSLLPLSPHVDSKVDLGMGDQTTVTVAQSTDTGSLDNGHRQDVEMRDATKEELQEERPAVDMNVAEVKMGQDGGVDFVGKESEVEEEKASPQVQVPSVVETLPASEVSAPSQRPPRLPSPPPRVPDTRNDAAQTPMQTNSEDTVTLTAKIEAMDAVVPKGPAGSAMDSTPDNVSSDSTTLLPTDEGVERHRAQMFVPVSVPTLSLSTPVSMSTSTSASTSADHSRANSIGVSASITSNVNAPPHAHVPTSSSSIPSSRRPSAEDGEIPASAPSKTYLPRSHTPPTQPRSFHAVHPPSPNFGPTAVSSTSVPRRPAPPLSRSPLSNTAGPAPTPIVNSRPLPSGPRALRGSISQPAHPPPYTPARPPYASSQYIPRGPSADRERMDRDRDRQWVASSRSRGRAGSNGWGR